MDYIQRIVTMFTEKHNTRDPYELANAEGIRVLFYPFSKIKGMIIPPNEHKICVINSLLPDNWQRFVLAHELGHYILSPAGYGYFFISENTLMEPKLEYEVNRFAMELLFGNDKPEAGESLEYFAARLGIPIELMRYRRIV